MKRRMDSNDMSRPYSNLRIQISKISEMADLGTKFSEAVGVDHLLSLIVKQTLDLMNAEVCIIWLKDKEGNLIPRISFGLRTDAIQSVKMKLGKGEIKCIMAKDGPTHIGDLAEERRMSLRGIIEEENLRSLLAEPMVVGDERIGVLMVCSKKAHKFNSVDLKIFNALAKQSALAITDIGLYEKVGRKVREKTKEMSLLFTLSRSLSSSIDLNLLLDMILDKARILMKAEFCMLRLLDNSRRTLRLASFVGVDKDTLKKVTDFENGLSKKVLRDANPLVVNDVSTYFRKRMPRFLKRNDIHSILMVPLFSNRRRIGVLSVYVKGIRIFEKEEIEMFEMVASLCSLAIDNATMLGRIRKDYIDSIKTLAKIIDANDPYTRGHCDKVMRYSLTICRRLGLPAWQMNEIRTASLLHDIGKIGIDLSIIRKEERLSAEDWEKVRLHPEIGARILSQTGFLEKIVPMIRHHHERFGGGGYPEPARQGEKIPIGARIIAVADAFDAMTSDRPYRKAMSKEDAVAELKKCSWTQFDPEVVNAFVNSKMGN